jgi:hypothetical protein
VAHEKMEASEIRGNTLHFGIGSLATSVTQSSDRIVEQSGGGQLTSTTQVRPQAAKGAASRPGIEK